ncbi:MAG: NAD(P) transhydrogenase subunit alpha [Chloroflexi bacterium]|nr:NAD(P) transhydrogenase subunit alpha [Chloroflexota bacterium]
MSLRLVVPRELRLGESRVALVPDAVAQLVDEGFAVVVERGAGVRSFADDDAYRANGANVIDERAALLRNADVVLTVRGLGGSDDESFTCDLACLRHGAAVVGLLDPYSDEDRIQAMADRGVLAFALERMPRITRAQSMDVLSSMSTITGYQAVLLAARTSPRMFPLLMTAAGTLAAARVLVLGAGVAGLQAIATARRLGALVQAYDVRPVVREQVESLGATFVSFDGEHSGDTAGGYATEQSEVFYARERKMLADALRDVDVAITTALVLGRRAPTLITAAAVAGMRPGSVIVDLAAERGGNCELSEPGETVVRHGVSIAAPLDLASSAPVHASQMYARNVSTFLRHIASPHGLTLDADDEIVRETMVTPTSLLPEESPADVASVAGA